MEEVSCFDLSDDPEVDPAFMQQSPASADHAPPVQARVVQQAPGLMRASTFVGRRGLHHPRPNLQPHVTVVGLQRGHGRGHGVLRGAGAAGARANRPAPYPTASGVRNSRQSAEGDARGPADAAGDDEQFPDRDDAAEASGDDEHFPNGEDGLFLAVEDKDAAPPAAPPDGAAADAAADVPCDMGMEIDEYLRSKKNENSKSAETMVLKMFNDLFDNLNKTQGGNYKKFEDCSTVELSLQMCKFLIEIRKKDGSLFMSSSLHQFVNVMARILKERKTDPINYLLNPEFERVRMVLKARAGEMAAAGKGPGGKAANPVPMDVLLRVLEHGSMGRTTPRGLVTLVWFLCTAVMGFRSTTECWSILHEDVKYGDLDEDGWPEWVGIMERKTKTLRGGVNQKREIQATIWGEPSNRAECAVVTFKKFESHKTEDQKRDGQHLFLGIKPAAEKAPDLHPYWYITANMGKNTISHLLTDALKAANVDPKPLKISATSARKSLAQALADTNCNGTMASKVMGHKYSESKLNYTKKTREGHAAVSRAVFRRLMGKKDSDYGKIYEDITSKQSGEVSDAVPPPQVLQQPPQPVLQQPQGTLQAHPVLQQQPQVQQQQQQQPQVMLQQPHVLQQHHVQQQPQVLPVVQQVHPVLQQPHPYVLLQQQPQVHPILQQQVPPILQLQQYPPQYYSPLQPFHAHPHHQALPLHSNSYSPHYFPQPQLQYSPYDHLPYPPPSQPQWSGATAGVGNQETTAGTTINTTDLVLRHTHTKKNR